MIKETLSKIGDACACPVAVIIKDEKVLMGLRHYTPDKWKTISVWTMPGGRCDAGETLEITLRRETEEEVGISDLEILDYIGEVAGAKEGDRVSIFFCKTSQSPQLMEPEKFSEWRWIDLKDYINGLPKNTINEDARHMIVNYIQNI